MASTNDTVGIAPVHTLIYYEQFAATALGPQFCLYGKGQVNAANGAVLTFNMATGASVVIGTLPTNSVGNPWGHFRFNNYIFLAAGGIATGFTSPANGAIYSWDGTTWRLSGLPAYQGNQTSGGFVVGGVGPTTSVQTSTVGSFSTTVLSGYQLYAAVYDPITQHMGNCAPFGARFTVGSTETIVVLSYYQRRGTATVPVALLQYAGNMGASAGELEVALGMTNDGGQVPYCLVDANGNNIVVGGTATVATVSIGNVNYLEELPFRNNFPPPFDKFARVGTRIFANLAGSPYIYYSNDAADITNSNYVGNPWESWPLDQAEPFPTGECPTSIHGGQFEGWFFSRTALAIFSSVLQQQGANPWRGPWDGGCCGQRAFVRTPYGNYWVSPEKQLCTFMDDGVISVSEEYEAALLGQLGDATLSNVEVAYLLDPVNRTDVIVIKGADMNGMPLVIVHDFLLKDERSPFGCGYQYIYSQMNIQTFAGAGYTPRQNVIDTNGKLRLWAGALQGFIAQLEDGSNSDNGAVYSADQVSIINMGVNRPGLAELEWQGDSQLQVSYTSDYSQGLAGLLKAPSDLISGETSRYGAKMSGEARWLYCRLQLNAHPSDGNFLPTNPPNMPIPTYGVIGEVTLKVGRERPEGR